MRSIGATADVVIVVIALNIQYAQLSQLLYRFELITSTEMVHINTHDSCNFNIAAAKQ